MTDTAQDLRSALERSADAYDDFCQKRAAMNAARPAINAIAAERALYDERYKADHEAEREHWTAAIALAEVSRPILSALAAPATDEPVADWRSFKRGPYVVYDEGDETYLAVGGGWHLDLDDGDSFAVFEDAQRAAEDADLGKVESYWVHQCPDLIHDAFQQFAHPPAAEPVGLREALEAARDVIQMVEMFDKGTPLLTFVGQKQVERASALIGKALTTPARTDDAAQAGGGECTCLPFAQQKGDCPRHDMAEKLMRDFYLSSAYNPKAERHADVVKEAIAFTLSTQAAYPTGAREGIPADVIALVVAGREAWEFLQEHQPHDGVTAALGKALEAFASRVCWDDDGGELPDAHADPCTCGSTIQHKGAGQ